MMARIAALSGAGSFAQALTTWDKSGLNATEVCESLCESPSEFPCKIWRREGDSNPRYLLGIHAFQACALNHSAISPCAVKSGNSGNHPAIEPADAVQRAKQNLIKTFPPAKNATAQP